jgi:inosine-uridine nucleoside N-ribohydrolase
MDLSVRRLIVDTDAGYDDFLAIAWLLGRRDIFIEAFTLVNGISDPDEGASALLLLQEKIAGVPAIPVYKGRERPLGGNNGFPEEWRHQATSIIEALNWGTPSGSAQPKNAEEFLIERLAPPNGPANILAIGPLSNLGSVFRQAPESVRSIQRLTIMGGSFGPEGAPVGNIPASPGAEGNIYVDPLAAQIVFSSGSRPILVPLNATSEVPIDSAFVESFRPATPLGDFAQAILNIIDTDYLKSDMPYDAWDPLAAMSLAVPSVLNNLVSLHVEVVQESANSGKTRTAEGDPNVRVALGADGNRFRKEYLSGF